MKLLLLRMTFLAAVFVLVSCGDFPSPGEKSGKEPELFTVAQWNVQTLFDGQETGKEYGEFLESAGWTAEKYAARITAISQVIPHMVQPDSEGNLDPNGSRRRVQSAFQALLP